MRIQIMCYETKTEAAGPQSLAIQPDGAAV